MPDDIESLDEELGRIALVLDEQRSDFPDSLLHVVVAIHACAESVADLEGAFLASAFLNQTVADAKITVFFMVSGRKRKLTFSRLIAPDQG